MNNKQEKVDCVFVGPVFGGYWVPFSEVEPIQITMNPRSFGLKRVSFYYEGKKWESAIANK